MGKINTLVVGQGLAGSVFSFMLYREQISFVVIDPGEASSASLVAAGMFTPISGQRKTIHPLTLQQIPVATNFFREAEALLACRLLHEQPVYQVFASATERDDFAAKMLQGNYAAHAVINGTTPVNVPQEFGGAAISPSGWVDCKKFILQWRRWLEGRNLLVQESFDHTLFGVTPQANKYKDIQFENIVFCEGFKGMHNPFFADQHIVPCKGEVL
ncbi:MAG: hypothetical protein Q7T76_18250, partial [Ferruginibacter sp.]|nr:hypothetical protein [Ferruginibacter sp.]